MKKKAGTADKRDTPGKSHRLPSHSPQRCTKANTNTVSLLPRPKLVTTPKKKKSGTNSGLDVDSLRRVMEASDLSPVPAAERVFEYYDTHYADLVESVDVFLPMDISTGASKDTKDISKDTKDNNSNNSNNTTNDNNSDSDDDDIDNNDDKVKKKLVFSELEDESFLDTSMQV